MSTFWSSGTKPLQLSRFKVYFDQGYVFDAKSVTQPSIDVSQSEYQLINHKVKIPGIATWGDIDIVFVEIGQRGKDLYTSLLKAGYNFNGKKKGDKLHDGIIKSNLPTLKVEKIKSGDGDIVETWEFINPMIKTLKYSDLDYSSDDLVTITLTVAFDSATLT